MVVVRGVARRQRHVAAVAGVAGPHQKVDVAPRPVGAPSRVAVDQNRHRRRALHHDSPRLVHLQPLVSLVVPLPDEDGRRVAIPRLIHGGVAAGVAPADGDSGRLPRSDLQPLLGSTLPGVKRQGARRVVRDILRIQSRDLRDSHLLLDHLVLLGADVHPLRVRVLVHHAARRHEAAVHRQVAEHVRPHRLRPAAADPHKRSAGGGDADQTLLAGVARPAIASVHDHVAAGAKLRVSTLKNQRPAVARVAVPRPHRHITTLPANGFAASDLHPASVAGRLAIGVARHHHQLAAGASLRAAPGSRCDEHAATLHRVGRGLPRLHHHGAAVFGVPGSNQHVHVATTPRGRRARRQGDRSAVSRARRARLRDDRAAHPARAAAHGLQHHVTARQRIAAPARHDNRSAAPQARLATTQLHVAAPAVGVRAVRIAARQHHRAAHAPRRQTSRDLDRASQAFLGAAAHHRKILRLRHLCGSAQVRGDLRRVVSKERAVARASVQHSLVHRHADVQPRAFVLLQVALLRPSRKPAGHLHHSTSPSDGILSDARDDVDASTWHVFVGRETRAE